jgi:hypothetical protein
MTIGYDKHGLMELFAQGYDFNVYEQDFDANGQSASGWHLTRPGAVKSMTVGYDKQGLMELLVRGMDDQVYEQDFNADGRSTSDWHLTRPGQVKSMTVGYDKAGLMELFVVGYDFNIYEQDFGPNGQSAGGWHLTRPGGVESLTVGYDKGGLMKLFAIGLDSQVYEQDFDANGRSASGWHLTRPGQVDENQTLTIGYNKSGLMELFVIGMDYQVYGQAFAANGYSAGGWTFTAAGWIASTDLTLPTQWRIMDSYSMQSGFPNLGGNYEVLAARTPPSNLAQYFTTYNCIAHTIGVHTQWVWPSSRSDGKAFAADFDRLYGQYGFQRVSDLDFSLQAGFEKIVLYGNVVNGVVEATHGAHQEADGTWTSKLGSNPLIRHATPQAVAGGTYGQPIAVYVRRR